MQRSLLSTLAVLSLTWTTTGCGNKNAAGGAPQVPVVRVTQPIEREVLNYEYFTGRTDAVDYVEVRARVTGYLTKIEFKPGKDVKEKQLLFEIDPRPYKADLDRVQGQLLLSEATLKLATAELARGKEISKTPGAISQSELDQLAAKEGQADASVKAQKAAVEGAALNHKFTEVFSPVNGVVGRNLMSLGNLVTKDSTLLTTVVTMDPMYAYFDVDERTMLNVQKLIREGKFDTAKEGSKVPVQFGLANEGDKYPHEGFLDFVNNQVDTSTGTLQVRGKLDNPLIGDTKTRLLTPGLFVRVRVPIGSPRKALVVPQAALGTDQGKKFLYVVNDKKVIEYRPITPGALQSDGLQVVEPMPVVRTKDGIRVAEAGEKGEPSLSAKDSIVIGGLQRIRSGTTVEAKAVAEGKK